MSYEPGTSECRLLIDKQGPESKRCWPISPDWRNTDTSGLQCLPVLTTRLEGLHDQRSKFLWIGFFRGRHGWKTPEKACHGHRPQRRFPSPERPAHAPKAEISGGMSLPSR